MAFRRFRQKIRDINERYRTPGMPMSRAVKAALMALRIYLLLLVVLMVYKFVTLLG